LAKGFVNLNRFKHGRTIKRDSKRKLDSQSNAKTGGKKVRFGGRLNELIDRRNKIAALVHIPAKPKYPVSKIRLSGD